jgi:hypothetical protein
MRSLLLALIAFALAITDARPAHAIAACNNNFDIAPRSGAVLPPKAKLVAFADMESWSTHKYTATLDGKPVAMKATKRKVAPYYLTELEVDSAKAGTLKVYRGTEAKGEPLATYTVKAGAAMPKEIAATTRRYTENIRHSTVTELFDALAIDLGDAPVILAHVKIRRDDKASWSAFDVPVHANNRLEPTKVKVMLGALGCTSNYTVALLENGVDLEVTAMLPDGSSVPVKLPKRVTLAKPAKQP